MEVAATGTGASARRLAAGPGGHIVGEIAWSPFDKAAHIGIIISSISQALQCLVVAPRLLQNIARDRVIPQLSWFAQLSRTKEPKRALLCCYIVSGLFVLIG